ncbi:type IV toxin-antitoxin system AbiEi family antitoxin domain-containing protein [Aquipuribacter sp. SD81]|uniref:type IV toxin-antitoxin system AbiEi family antitoxin domain-containing protein n=1 Tax=Aquipuribacter sp. SD81 TaxID=3127703 RepID=UPI0030192404
MDRAVVLPFPPALIRRVVSQDGAVTWAQLRDHGVDAATLRRLLRAGVLERARRGVYVVRSMTNPGNALRLRCRTAALATNGVVSGPSAARLWGLAGTGDGDTEVVVPPSRRATPAPDLRPRRRLLAAGDVTHLQGLAVTTPGRTLVDVVTGTDRVVGLAVLDSALRTGLVSPADLPVLARRAQGTTGCAATTSLWAWADGRAESVLESRVRLRLLDAGLVPDELQLEVRDRSGRLVGRVDMAFRRRTRGRRGLLVVEADGVGPHSTPEALHVDRVRSNALVAEGHDVVRVTWKDTDHPGTIPAAVRAVL